MKFTTIAPTSVRLNMHRLKICTKLCDHTYLSTWYCTYVTIHNSIRRIDMLCKNCKHCKTKSVGQCGSIIKGNKLDVQIWKNTEHPK